MPNKNSLGCKKGDYKIITMTGKNMQELISRSSQQEKFGKGKIWWTIQVKAIGKEKLVNKLQSVHMPITYIFSASVNIDEGNFGE